ncbi:Polynucleotide 5'-hydroxyl-kinase GRC3 [Neonectria ditissima]|uniref:Polynucleotide 5'-hydroxyl-kinase GRC3 n=1 Tax=Neonectria ditissima TaxID=78410 RepID=A0A0P7B8U6_9HYPO|nr:Polynucleotide 5'-hydroxyl-kinase GRC3 [Neonectria ditissima]
MSAISALAARRREAANASTPTTDATPEVEDQPVITTTNFYSPLQKSGSKGGPNVSPSKSTPRPHLQKRGSEPHQTRLKGADFASDGPGTTASESAADSQKILQYSSFRPSKRNHRVKTGGVVELRLEQSERFLVLGSFGIRVLRGEVTIAGAFLRPSETIQWVHAPHCHAVPVLRSADNTGLELHPDSTARGLRQLGRLSPLFRKMWNESADMTVGKRNAKEATFQILYTAEDVPKRCIIQELVSPPEWNKKISALVSATRKKPSLSTLVCGPKSAGKSTFSRILTNRLITDRNLGQNSKGIAILDLDPGQPEYAPAGTVSLVHVTQPNLSSPFTHPGVNDSASKVIRFHALASVTPATDPSLYLACATDLYDTYRKTLKDIPLIVNTPGWILGTGLDLLSEVISQVKPDEVLYMSEEGPFDTVDTLSSATKSTFAELPSQQSEFTSRTAAHLRAMQTMSYFHLDEPSTLSSNSPEAVFRVRWNHAPLSVRPPFLVKYSSPRPGIQGILSYDYQAPPELLADAINGAVLALVEIEDAKAFGELERDWPSAQATGILEVDTSAKLGSPPVLSTTPEGLPFIPNYNDIALDPRHSRAIGLVLLRGIDREAKTLQLLTPISSDVIRDVKSRGRDIVLVHGKFDTPSWAYTEDLYEQAGNDEGNDEWLDVTEEDTDDDDSDAEPEDVEKVSDLTAIPWVEVLKGNQRRPVGSRVWRVRRDLGRGAGD